ncbi:thioesterase [Endomicrobiia bacterium]|uniref:Acyl-CoA thioesterase n=1 Tax=Endomicrobium trichonymphae TaxID=1408204 RepID=B1H0N7_ENDTX|nr:thioesterase family protein [Candidatus Endomicrobium trichonymphae]GHT06064.1 thioesterase [Endomicrobiia bacterium]BAG14069.1 acyl-CoA thioesterase [Candidatus Endomicrobium trichonymphae]BAV59129.1 putative thioesterase [Candidatus Endomicrobium trichonymphae]GHT13397.1 thioesterase [Endomicrobiia bacterium]GHT15330.1 thioesterase [Endomicrobiia bacterium]
MNVLHLRIAYADTDQMGMVYYGNYLTFFERGRAELLRDIGFEYKTIEKRGFYFPVIYAECKYLAPAKYDDVITIETRLTEVTAASTTCSYKVKCDGKLLVTGKTKHPFVNKMMRPVRFPEDIKELIEKHLEK